MPVGTVYRGEGPFHGARAEAGLQVLIFDDIGLIVEHESIPEHRPEGRQYAQNQTNSYQELNSAAGVLVTHQVNSQKRRLRSCTRKS